MAQSEYHNGCSPWWAWTPTPNLEIRWLYVQDGVVWLADLEGGGDRLDEHRWYDGAKWMPVTIPEAPR